MKQSIINTTGSHSSAITANGELFEWGKDISFTTHVEDAVCNLYPVKVAEDVVYAKSYDNTLIIDNNGRLFSRGIDSIRGEHAKTRTRRYPLFVMDDVIIAEPCGGTSLVVTSDNTLWGWGSNWGRSLISCSKLHSYSPVKIMTDVQDICYTGGSTFAIKTDNTLWGWGPNVNGSLGTPCKSTIIGSLLFIEDEDSAIYSQNQILSDVVKISTGYGTFAINTKNQLLSWGSNGGDALANTINSTPDVLADICYTPTVIMEDIVDVSVAYGCVMVVDTAGGLWTWGTNRYGQLGDGTTTDRYKPKKIMDGVVAISSGGYHALALTQDGTLWAWGSNNYGQLGIGDNSLSFSAKPIKVMGGVMLP